MHSLPDSLHVVNESLDDSGDVDRIDVPFLQLVIQHVHVWHYFVEEGQEKTEIIIFQHSHIAARLSLCGAVKFSSVPDGLKTLHQVRLVFIHCVNSADVEVPARCRCTWKSMRHHLIKHCRSLA